MRQIATFIALCAAAAAFSQQDLPQWSAGASFVGGGLTRGNDGNFYRALKNNMGQDPTKDNHTYWELYYARSPLNYTVASSKATFKSLKQAWSFISSAFIASPATISIHISTVNGVYAENFTSPLNLDDPCGAQISIAGDDATKITLTFASGISGIALDNSHSFGGITDVTLDGTSASGSSTAVSVADHSSLGTSKFTIKNFANGVVASVGSRIVCDGTSVANCSFYAFEATTNSTVSLRYGNANGVGVGYVGVYALLSSTIDAYQTQMKNFILAGYYSTLDSCVSAISCLADTCVTGYYAATHGTMEIGSAFAKNNSFGYHAVEGSIMTGKFAAGSSNTTNFSPAVNTASADLSYISG